MTYRYAFLLEYDGGCFSGWQSQHDHPVSVQKALELALCEVTQESVSVYGSGRTDAGVHGCGQVAHSDFTRPMTFGRLHKGTNYYLKSSGLQVLDVRQVDDRFHARFSAVSRIYRYVILPRPNKSTLWNHRAWWVSRTIDLERLHKASQMLVGSKDFSNFRNAACQAKNPVRTLDRVTIEEHDGFLWLTFQAQSFLYRQVRMMTGAMVRFATHTIQHEDMMHYFDPQSRLKPLAAPAHGLYLKNILYPYSVF
jgi:tRNA pseudouridine38-40 synthase